MYVCHGISEYTHEVFAYIHNKHIYKYHPSPPSMVPVPPPLEVECGVPVPAVG